MGEGGGMVRSEGLPEIRTPSPPPRCARPREVGNLAYIVPPPRHLRTQFSPRHTHQLRDMNPHSASERQRRGNIPAQGNALGLLETTIKALKGRDAMTSRGTEIVPPLQGFVRSISDPGRCPTAIELVGRSVRTFVCTMLIRLRDKAQSPQIRQPSLQRKISGKSCRKALSQQHCHATG